MYKVFQSLDEKNWKVIGSQTEIATVFDYHKEFQYTIKEENLIIPFSGYYHFKLFGAQGKSYRSYQGGKGGEVGVTIYAHQGEQISFALGRVDGYLGGGIGSIYGNGGGYSILSSNRLGVIAIAGGGSGASLLENGNGGGGSLSEIGVKTGNHGMTGGGAGAIGGKAGTILQHYHGKDCVHQHIGSETSYGACYLYEAICKGEAFRKVERHRTFYRGNIDNNGNHIFCVRCGSYTCPGHLDIFYRYVCERCGASYNDMQPTNCSHNVGYELSCTVRDSFICGKRNGEMIEHTLAEGGTSFIRKESCLNYFYEGNVNAGDGKLQCIGENLGFQNNHKLENVIALDLEAPVAISKESVEMIPLT